MDRSKRRQSGRLGGRVDAVTLPVIDLFGRLAADPPRSRHNQPIGEHQKQHVACPRQRVIPPVHERRDETAPRAREQRTGRCRQLVPHRPALPSAPMRGEGGGNGEHDHSRRDARPVFGPQLKNAVRRECAEGNHPGSRHRTRRNRPSFFLCQKNQTHQHIRQPPGQCPNSMQQKKPFRRTAQLGNCE